MNAHDHTSPDTRSEAEVLRDRMPRSTDTEHYAMAVDLVEAGYKTILGVFNAAKDRGAIPRGRVLAEMITSGDWSPPPLLTTERFEQFCQLTNQCHPTDILSTLWYIVEHVCGELRLVPAITIDRETGHVVVTLAL